MTHFFSIYVATLLPMIVMYYVAFPLVGHLLERLYAAREPLPPLPAGRSTARRS